MKRRGKWIISLFSAVILAALALYLRGADLRSGTRWLPPCTLNSMTGLHCPGCGNTRAAHAILHGDVAGAVQQNILFVIAIPFLGLGALRVWVDWVYPGKWKPLPFRWRWGYSLVIISFVVAFGILRNVPKYPYSWLAPVPLSEVKRHY
ncbi:DUF2752 domain-containing protein [Verrucomicrobiales bacterium]|jgi:hypothetical protein|nr:DUF2752 domain-containing protein [Verrucomicrobiales bacterium]MDB4358932.1 DUF2752 domain-containing protein [Verrucomicrobiales bacterium]|tara:strand:+ start:63 stop:509 length:447 start_codon:yes stop_codon:yes gene_type:complete